MKHSAEVDMWLETEAGMLPLSQTGPDFVITTNPTDYTGPATLVLVIDGETTTRKVIITDAQKAFAA